MPMAEEDRGWKVFDPDYCESRCPICTRARRGNRLAKILQTVEMIITFGGCPWGRARRRKYGVPPGEPRPPESESGAAGK
jgi:hypothetical protein